VLRADAPVNRDVPPERLRGLLARSTASRKEGPGAQGPLSDSRKYVDLNDVELETTSPLHNAVLGTLIDAFPRALTYTDLEAAVVAQFERHQPDAVPAARNELPLTLAELLQNGFVQFHVWQPVLVTTPGVKPEGWLIARARARTDEIVPTLAVMSAKLSPVERFVLVHSDGTKTHAELAELLRTNAGQFVDEPGHVLNAPATLAKCLERLASGGLLVK
jgi:methyltransferase-like protein